MIWNWRNAFVGLACAALLWLSVGPGHSEDARKAEGQAIANELMEQWKRANPNRDWVAEEKERHKIKPSADNSSLLRGGQSEGDVYGKYTKQDILMWERELEKFVVEGSSIFHDADLLGSSIAVSCDMCHPDASNTHPETYPKFQVQMGRVVLLRDMINWCIEQAIRGETFGADDPRMRALEAYILAQRKGIELNYGKH
jgi:thiosulfate dehydrogenase